MDTFKVELLKMCEEAEHKWLEDVHRRMSFFGGLISALVAATIAGFLEAEKPAHQFILLAGPALIYFVSIVAKEAVSRSYNRFLETITMRAKVEHDLEMTDPRGDKEKPWWESEALVTERHLLSRGKSAEGKEIRSSMDFVGEYSDQGTMRIYKRFLGKVEILAFLIAFIIFASATYGWINPG